MSGDDWAVCPQCEGPVVPVQLPLTEAVVWFCQPCNKDWDRPSHKTQEVGQ